MRKTVLVLGLVVVLALSAVVTRTILAQDGSGTNKTAWLGIGLADATDGVTVTQVVSGSPAAASGLLVGDVIKSIDGNAVTSANDLVQAVQGHAPGDTVTIVVTRNGEDRSIDVELGTAPTRQGAFSLADMDPQVIAERVLHVELDTVDNGYKVLADGRTSQDQTGLVAGDVITAVNGTPVASVDWATLINDLSGSSNPTLTLTVQRNGQETTVELTPFAGFGGRGPGFDRDFGHGFDDGMHGNNFGQRNAPQGGQQQQGAAGGAAYLSSSSPA